jgi:hypothetical protein
MHIDEIQRIVIRLANQSWVRWWANFGDRQTDVLMAVQCLDFRYHHAVSPGRYPIECDDLLKLGFTIWPSERQACIYTIPRTNEDGSPFVSQLF